MFLKDSSNDGPYKSDPNAPSMGGKISSQAGLHYHSNILRWNGSFIEKDMVSTGYVTLFKSRLIGPTTKNLGKRIADWKNQE